jgi:hypothetical protein
MATQATTIEQCLMVNQLEELKKIALALEKLSVLATIGTKRMDVYPYSLTAGKTQRVLPADPGGAPRKVLIVVEPRTDLPDVALAVSPNQAVSADAGPVFGVGTSHDFGVVPATVELWAQQRPATGAADSTLRVWVVVSV